MFAKYSRNSFLALLSVVLFASGAARALDLYWDANGATGGTGGTGIWDTGSAIWRVGSPTGALQAWAQGSNAVFEGTGGTVTLMAGIQAGTISFQTTGYTLTGNPLTLASANGAIDVSAGLQATINSTLAGTAGLTKTGTGILALAGLNSYTGNTNINAGALRILPPQLVQNNSFEVPYTVFVTSVTLAGPVDPSSMWTFTASNGGNSGIAAAPSNQFYWVQNPPDGNQCGLLQGANSSISQSISFPAAGDFSISFYSEHRAQYQGFNPFNVQIDGTTILPNVQPPNSNSFTQYNANFSISTAGAHTLSFVGLGNNNMDVTSYVDKVVITQTGTVNANAIPDSSPVNIAAGATLNLAGNAETIASLAGPGDVTLGAGALTVGSAASTEFSGVSTGNGSLTKIGAGTQTFSGNLSHIVGTTVNAGALNLLSTTFSPTTVKSGGTLAGVGTAAAVTVEAGGKIAPGNNGAGILNTGTLTLNTNALLDFDVGSATDRISVTGNLALAGQFNIIAGPGIAPGGYRLISFTGTRSTGTFTVSGNTPFNLALDNSPSNGVDLLVTGGAAVTSIVRANVNPTNASNVNFTVTFSTDVSGVDVTDFTLTTAGIQQASVSQVVPQSASVYTVTAATGTGDGTLRLDLIDDNSIRTVTGNLELGGPALNDGDFTTGEVYSIERTGPSVTVNQAAGQPDPALSEPVDFTVQFSKAVSDFTQDDVTVTGTATPGLIAITPIDEQNYTVSLSQITGEGNMTVTIAAGVAHDSIGNGNIESTSTDNTVYVGLPVAPAVIEVSSGDNDATYNTGATLTISVGFSKSVNVSGNPRLLLNTGRQDAAALFGGGSGSTILLFIYTVVAGDNTIDLEYVDANSLDLNGGTIADTLNNQADVTLPDPGTVGSLSNNKQIVLDTKPVINSVSPAFGMIAGGASVTIVGINLDSASVTFDTDNANVTSPSSTHLVVTSPPHAKGVVDVHVTGPGGSATATGAFTYYAPATLSSISPSAGPTAGGQAVTLSGSNFIAGATVSIGGTPATNVVIQDSTTITAVTPAHLFGTYNVTVTLPIGQSSTLNNSYTFNAPPSLSSAAVITPSILVAGRPVTVSVAASDPESDTVTITYDWGDSTTSLSNTHIYAAAGTYTISIILFDGINTVTAQQIPITVIGITPLTISKLAGAFSFKKAGADSCQISGILPEIPIGTTFGGKTFLIDVGGATANFTLDAKGKAKSSNGSLALKVKLAKNGSFIGGNVPFQVKFKGALVQFWADEGITAAATLNKTPLSMRTDVFFLSKLFSGDATVLVSSKPGIGGKFKK